MKGKVPCLPAGRGTPCSISYRSVYLPKKTFKLVYYEKLSEKAKIKLKAINLYKSKKYTVEQICEIFEIDRSTFYRWRKSYNSRVLQSLEDKSKKPKRTRRKVVRTYEVEHAVCEIRRKYPYFGKEKIKRILERECKINVSASSVGRILSQYRFMLPKTKVARKRAKTRKKNKVRLNQVKKDMVGKASECPAYRQAGLQADTIELRLNG